MSPLEETSPKGLTGALGDVSPGALTGHLGEAPSGGLRGFPGRLPPKGLTGLPGELPPKGLTDLPGELPPARLTAPLGHHKAAAPTRIPGGRGRRSAPAGCRGTGRLSPYRPAVSSTGSVGQPCLKDR
ncbi:hypothetical protein HOK021_11000 [Streptomyces hygroscopicus]|nr:hypothetical protein HOK021_11000 [Streptomyces hygroscopicus]